VNAYTSDRQALKAWPAGLARIIRSYEQACEEHNGLGPEVSAHIRAEVLSHGLQAINMPAAWEAPTSASGTKFGSKRSGDH